MSDIVTGKIFVDGEKGITATKLNQIQSLAVIQPDFYLNKASSPTLDPTDVLLELKGTGSYAQITGANLISSVSASVSGQRPRSFNAIGNPTFEVDQRLCGASAPIVGQAFAQDRWIAQKAGGTTMAATSQQVVAGNLVQVPGTNFSISNKVLRITLTAQQATLAAGDLLFLVQNVEGARMRELFSDVHSLSILVRSSVAGLSFGVTLRDPPTVSRSLTKLCTITSANVWQLITLPNLPVWAAGGNWSVLPGVPGYTFNICLAAGSTWLTPANDTWQTGNFVGAIGQSNFAASPINSTVDLAFCQHEPGAPTTPIDCPFGQNLDGDMGCLRYFQKSWSYSTAVGTVDFKGSIGNFIVSGATAANGGVQFKKIMAKAPTVAVYNPNTGLINTAYNGSNATAVTIGSVAQIGDSGFMQMTGSGFTVGNPFAVHYTADTGW